MTLLIRPATATDAPALGVLEGQLAAYHAEIDPTQHRAIVPDGTRLWAKWQVENKKAWVAEKNGTVVGFLALEERSSGQEPFDSRATETVWYINMVTVEETLRGQGIGTALMAHAEAEARKVGVDTLAITYMQGNPGAENLYTTLGFRPAKITMRKAL